MMGNLKTSAGKNIVYGLLFFIIIAVGTGMGSFISIVAAGEETLFAGVLGSMMIIFTGPIIASFIGIIQGKLARNGGEALIAGGVTGVVGYFLLMFIVVAFLAIGIAIRFPATGNGGVSVNLGPMIAETIAIFLPSGIIGALSALISMKYIFRTPEPYFPVMEESAPQQHISSPQQQYAPMYQQQTQTTQKQYQQPLQQEVQFSLFDCPHCGKPFKTHMIDRPMKVQCPSCNQGVIVGL